MKRKTLKKISLSSKTKEDYYEEIVVKPAKRLVEALHKAKEKKSALKTKVA